MGSRRKARRAAVQMLYQLDLSEAEPEEAVQLFHEHFLSPDRGHAEVHGTRCFGDRGDDEALVFADALVRGCAAEQEKIDDRIRSVSRHWRLERMARVDRNIIRLATSELLTHPEIPPRVTLNEAVELAKHFGDENSPSFVNGVLDRIAAGIEKEIG